MTITFSKEQVELGRVMHLLEERHLLLLRWIVPAAVECGPHQELLSAVERVEKVIGESGYAGSYLDVAVYAEACFRQEEAV